MFVYKYNIFPHSTEEKKKTNILKLIKIYDG